MPEETRKRVTVEYKVEDHAAGALGEIGKKAEGAGKRVEKLKDNVKEFRHESLAMAAGVLGVGLGFGAMIEKIKESNVEFGAAQKSIAATQATILDWPKSMSAVDKFTGSMRLAKGTTKELEEAAAAFGMGLPDMAAAYKTVGVSAAPLHLSQKQWIDLTIKSAAAAKQFGISGEEAANTIGKALVTKSIRASSDLGKYLHEEVGGNLKKLNNAQILAKMDKALGQSTEIAKKMGEGFGGSLGRIQLKVDEIFRDVSGPLFSAVAGALDGLSAKLGAIEENGKSTLANYADDLVAGFNTAADVSKTILGIWGKIGSELNKATGGAASFSAAVGAASGAKAGMMVGGLPGALVGAMGGSIAGQLFDDKMQHDKGVERLKAYKDLMASAQGMTAGLSSDIPGSDIADQQKRAAPFVEAAQKMGLNDPRVQSEKIGEMRELIAAAGEDTEKALGMSAKEARALSEKLKDLVGNLGDEMSPSWLKKIVNPDDLTKNLKTQGRPQVTFTGDNHFDMKFEDTDPDRVMLRFQEGVENDVLRRTSSPLSDPLAD